MRQTYASAGKILGRYGVTLQNVVEEVLYVTDMDAAFSAAGPVRKKAYASAGGKRDAMKPEAHELRGLRGIRPLPGAPHVVSALISPPESS